MFLEVACFRQPLKACFAVFYLLNPNRPILLLVFSFVLLQQMSFPYQFLKILCSGVYSAKAVAWRPSKSKTLP